MADRIATPRESGCLEGSFGGCACALACRTGPLITLYASAGGLYIGGRMDAENVGPGRPAIRARIVRWVRTFLRRKFQIGLVATWSISAPPCPTAVSSKVVFPRRTAPLEVLRQARPPAVQREGRNRDGRLPNRPGKVVDGHVADCQSQERRQFLRSSPRYWNYPEVGLVHGPSDSVRSGDDAQETSSLDKWKQTRLL
jgi:hypothetical protein